MKKMFDRLNENVYETAFSVLGVALLLMLPRNLLKLPYWIAIGSWVVADMSSDNSRLERLSELV